MRREDISKEEAFWRLRAENSQAKSFLLFGEKEKRSNQWAPSAQCVKNRAIS